MFIWPLYLVFFCRGFVYFFQDSQRLSQLNPRNGLVGLFVKIESEEDGGRYVVNASATAKKEGF